MNVARTAPSIVRRVLDATEQVFVEQGFDKTTIQSVATQSGVTVGQIKELYPSRLDLMVAMLNREYMNLFQEIIQDVERDPRGGLLSRLYTYILSQIYQRPVARKLFMIDRNALHDLVSHQHAIMYVPSVETRSELIAALQEAGMVRADADPAFISRVVSVISGGLAITSPHQDLDAVVGVMMHLIRDQFDADVIDTTPGKRIYQEWAARLDQSTKIHHAL